MEKIKIGKIVNAVGLRGEVKVYNYSDSEEVYERTPEIYAEDKLLKVENVRVQKNMVILKLSGIDDRNEAEAAKGVELYITESDLPELPEGVFYVRELIGMNVVESEKDMFLGTVTDVIQNIAQDIFEVDQENGKKILIPKVDEFILNIDKEQKTIYVKLIEGLLEL
ncbi:MAG: ribosome maturation factor RimM [Anaerovoracaceae bacterium]